MASCAKDLTIKIWSLQKFTCLKTLKGHEHNVTCVQFTPSGDYVLSGSWDKTIRVWEVASGFCVKTLEGQANRVLDIAINEKGTLMASSGNSNDVVLWTTDWKSNNCLKSYFDEEHEN